MRREAFSHVLAWVVAVVGFAAGVQASASEGSSTGDMVDLMFAQERTVAASTRAPQPVSRVAENVTVITAEEIRATNAHTISEVLRRVTGLFVDSFGDDFGSSSLLGVQGSSERHVLLLVDEIPWNTISGGNALSDTIPVEIIERIEVIKGPASSTWGSSLGGVINIITKRPAARRAAAGMISTSAGEGRSVDSRAVLSGTKDAVDYYFFAGKQRSSGLLAQREYDDSTFFGKVGWVPTEKLRLAFSAGASNPDRDYGDLRYAGLLSQDENRALWARAEVDGEVSQDLTAHLSVYRFDQRFQSHNQEDGLYGPSGDLFKDLDFDEENWGGSGRLVWSVPDNVLVAGVDYRDGSLDYTAKAGDYLQSPGGGSAPAVSSENPESSIFGLYVNDTAVVGEWTFLPGVRLDHDSDWGWVLSPSLGVSRKVGDASILRGTVARGFNAPSVGALHGTGVFLKANEQLDPERVWSYQLGLETGVVPGLWLKASGFLHDVDKALDTRVVSEDPYQSQYFNGGHVRRTGFEVEARTERFYGFWLQGGFTKVYIRPEDSSADSDRYAADLGLRYAQEIVELALLCHYVSWDFPGQSDENEDPIYDLFGTFHLWRDAGEDKLALFFSARNLFNGKQYTTFENPDSWAEAGFRWQF